METKQKNKMLKKELAAGRRRRNGRRMPVVDCDN